jgi:hypothetical protein
MQEDVTRRKEVKEEEEGSGNSSIDSVNSGSGLGLPNLYTTWMDPLVRVACSGLNQRLFRLDRVKYSSCDCPAKIPVNVYSNASCFTCFSSSSSSPEVAEFCLTLCLVYFITQA